tara:strand:+ start:1145 stop:1372 length:228 start_codon:yes stop_codon:yes gene_type:complete
MKAQELRQYLDKFLVSPAAKQARVQIEMPNGEKLDVYEIQLLESRIIGDRDTHILNLKGIKRGGTWKMGKIVGKL